MKSQRRFLIIGSAILTIGNISVRLLNYFYRILMGRLLSPYQYGILNLALPIQFIVILLTSAGIAPSVAKFVSEKKGRINDVGNIYSSTLTYYGIGGTLLGFLFFLISDPLGRRVFGDLNAIMPLKISAIALPFGIMISVYTGVFQGLKKVDYMSITLILEQAMRILFALVLVKAGLNAIGAIGGSTIGIAAALPISFFLSKKVGLKFGKRSIKVFREIFYFSIPTSITALSSFILAYADIILIGYFMNPVNVGIYSAASPASRLLLALTTALYAVLIPLVSEATVKSKNNDLNRYFKLSHFAVFAVILPLSLVLLIFSNAIIGLLFTERYLEAVASFEILVLGMVFLSLFMINSAIFQGIGSPNVPMKILLAFSFLDILLNIFLIPTYGIEGAAFSTSLSSIGAGIVSSMALAKYLNTIE